MSIDEDCQEAFQVSQCDSPPSITYMQIWMHHRKNKREA